MIEMKPVESTNIAAAGHDPVSGTLKVQFRNGAVHEYRDVPPQVAAGLHDAESAGRYFGTEIRGQYESERVVEENQGA